ncbi:MAG: hypothetical protein CMQ46_05320 [Gammaproteobacteria bacterium]|nr:hypothetical protein [Gammaproteobacteria bacterium]
MQDIVIVAAGRTAIGNFQGSLADIPAAQLGSEVIKQLMVKSNIKQELIDEVIMGHVLTAGCGQNTARQASINAGLGVKTPAMTVNKVCGSCLRMVENHLRSGVSSRHGNRWLPSPSPRGT